MVGSLQAHPISEQEFRYNMEKTNLHVTVLGAGLAGCEAALWLADKGVQVHLVEQKPVHFSPAHQSEGFAELICSNSLKAERLDSASGLLKEGDAPHGQPSAGRR
jgi:folate-dependent tRNA-U54 methylase TrmFO/GidA